MLKTCTRSLVASLLLFSLASSARAAYTTHPGTWDNCVLYLPSYSLYPEAFKQTAGGAAAGIGDPVGEVDSGVSTWKWDAANTPTERRPVIASDGGLQFGTIAATARYLRMSGSGAYTKVLHEDGMYFMIRFRMDDAIGSGASRMLFDSTNLSNTTRGVRAHIQNDDTVLFRANNTNAGSPVVNIATTNTVPDNELDHVIKGVWAVGSGKSWIQLDRGTKIFGTAGTPSAGNAGVIYLGNRSSLDRALPGRIYELWIGTAPPTAAQEAEWDAHNAYGSVTGRTVLETPTYRCELEPTYGYVATRNRYDGYLVNSVAGSEGSVYRIGSTWYGAVHAVDMGGTPETINETEVWLDGVSQGSVVESAQYKALNEAKFRRQVTSALAYELDSTITLKDNKFTEDLYVTRKNDGNTVVISYPIRCGRALLLAPYRLLDATGAITASGTVTTDSSNDVSSQNTPAVAQFDSAAGQMVLTTLTKGLQYQPYCEIFGTAENCRIYWRSLEVANATAGQEFHFKVETRVYPATVGTWEALAQSETAKILGASPKGRIGIGTGIGISSKQIKIPDEYSIAP